ncbi:DinB family protein [Aurantibacter crassamenti]|uniref:DinB family protein n=1 Tax=Aurantibacter crassamenti TaxID=1837375 RepID=UPI00193A388E|nr:DinB family protein [Aurantibacter crassamenti]MBM1105369.1 DinB family protein [Aurantibacter crassamenti]
MSQQEIWLSGPIPEIPALLQPAAHALLQSVREVKEYLLDFPEDKLWETPFNRAAVGFHLQHLTGVLDRMLTYAQEKSLSEEQFNFLKIEKNSKVKKTSTEMITAFELKVDEALNYFKSIPENTLTELRTIGRKKLPSTLIGLLFHAAEHSQRHVGQLLVTVSALKA